jgi:hypothetical protein
MDDTWQYLHLIATEMQCCCILNDLWIDDACVTRQR